MVVSLLNYYVILSGAKRNEESPEVLKKNFFYYPHGILHCVNNHYAIIDSIQNDIIYFPAVALLLISAAISLLNFPVSLLIAPAMAS